MRSRSSVVLVILLLGVTACDQLLGIGQLHGPGDATTGTDGGPPGPAANCKAQRAVYLVGGNAGLAWFTLAWPAPAVITGYQTTYAYDSPTNVKEITVEAAHPLFSRRIGARAIWEGLGQDPYPSAFVAGSNETHTTTPTSTMLVQGSSVTAASTVLQVSLQPTYAALVIGGLSFGAAPGSIPPVATGDVEGAIGIFPPAIQTQVRPSAAQIANYVPAGATTVETTLGTQLAYTANAFRLGLLGTVMLKAFNDDPHAAFDSGTATQRANNLATMLDAFYRDLSMSNETACGRGGNFLSLADNVVTVVTGDTPKNSFVSMGWADGTTGNANFIYVRSNGFLRPGWFGKIDTTGKTEFDPNTGVLDPMGSAVTAAAAALTGVLYAIARGDKVAVRTLSSAAFDGTILH